MSEPKPITFVIAVSSHGNAGPSRGAQGQKRRILENNFLASPCVRDPHPHQILLQEDFSSAGLAFNDAIDKSKNDLIIFCHQDIFLPENWMSQLQTALEYLEQHDPKWGVLGVSGTNPDHSWGGHIYSSGVGIIGRPSEPIAVQTLDEIVLILRKSSGLRFDETLPHFHLYGSDICLRAAKKGMKSYAISAFCVHNTYANYVLAPEFYKCCDHVRRVWREELPIQTTCVRLTAFDMPVRWRRLREAYFKYIRRKPNETKRADDVRSVFEELSGRI